MSTSSRSESAEVDSFSPGDPFRAVNRASIEVGFAGEEDGSGGLDELEMRAHIVKWVAETGRPLDIVSDSMLINILKAGRSHINVPSPITVRHDIKAVYAKWRSHTTKLLQNHSGCIHIATGERRSINHRAYVACVVHLEHKNRILALLLDIVEVSVPYTPLVLAKAFQKMLEQYGLEKKILGLTTEISISNVHQREDIAYMNNSFELKNHMHCFNHVLQLSAKALLSPFHPALGNGLDIYLDTDDLSVTDDDDHDEGYVRQDILDIDDIADDEFDELDNLDSRSRKKFIEDTAAVRTTISKLCGLSSSITWSITILLPAWRCYCKKLSLEPRTPPRNVARWNSTLDVLTFALEYRTAIDAITADKTWTLGRFELKDDEWLIVKDLVVILEKFKNVALHFSEVSASIAEVIPAIDKLTGSLNDTTYKSYHPAIVLAIELARKKMHRYYPMDSLSAYHIAVMLHPGMKSEYFCDRGWNEQRIKEAENLLRERYDAQYKTQAASVGPTQKGVLFSFGGHSVTTGVRVSELDQYLRSPTENVGNEGPLTWWTRNKGVYPSLHRMALDYLSIPATSTVAKRISLQRHLASIYRRNAPSPSSIQAFLCVGSWVRCGIIGFDDLLAVVSRTEMHVVADPVEV